MPHVGEEIFIDCGAYDGKTSLNFINWAGGNEMYKKIICFEPDENNLEICKRTLQQYHDITYIRKGLWDHTDTLRFNTAQMSSAISNTGDIEIPVITIDEVCKDIPVTFVKMDIEGSELKALKGAQETIKNNKPKLAISIYHKTEHIFDIPKFISDLVPSYKYYIRHYSFYEDETVLYAV